ncbi:FAD:protein FMN transferase [Prosthecochloris sp. CIB 2401]|uniref:FAD:protein FMN transferase n=1 Tax=Prosthecochloris sp. CIB 2401 TaxID=1868325 RepID=UPI00080ABF83|nr:FAD:protein FMN transferase [Prosthecochloris sp. CIB 2401]ANT64325.1 ApbE family protein [Prosthecochloris sp. CIB 2401]
MMGTIMKIKAVAPGNAEDSTKAAFEAAFREMSELESELSEWQPASPVSAVNREAEIKGVKVPDAVVTVTEKALEMAKTTGGELGDAHNYVNFQLESCKDPFSGNGA